MFVGRWTKITAKLNFLQPITKITAKYKITTNYKNYSELQKLQSITKIKANYNNNNLLQKLQPLKNIALHYKSYSPLQKLQPIFATSWQHGALFCFQFKFIQNLEKKVVSRQPFKLVSLAENKQIFNPQNIHIAFKNSFK